MSSILFELIFIILLTLINGVLAMSELAVVSARKVRLQQRAEAGHAGAQAALKLAEDPGQFLSTVQIGITLVGILAGALGGATIAEEIGVWLARIPLLSPYAEAIGVGVVVLLITYLSLVLGELTPKRLALNNAEGIAATVAPFMRILAIVTAPFVRLLRVSSDL
ncbi:MAG: CNNM domain-containing protein, partial [Chloroflexota bacterium]|nr:CNNM domain-containing protein [Chloroflexota bacterium]